MSGYAIHALIHVDANGKTDEATQEFDTFDQALAAVDELAAQRPSFRAITIVHREDLVRLTNGSSRRGVGEP